MNTLKLILVGLFSFCIASIYAQQNFDGSNNSLYAFQASSNELPVNLGQVSFLSPEKTNADGSGKGMRNAGIILTVGGVVMSGAGYALARHRTRNFDFDDDNLVLPGLGIAMVINSIGLVVPGIILTAKGSSKYKNGGASFKTTGDSVGFQLTF